jgi:hypothetical protein
MGAEHVASIASYTRPERGDLRGSAVPLRLPGGAESGQLSEILVSAAIRVLPSGAGADALGAAATPGMLVSRGPGAWAAALMYNPITGIVRRDAHEAWPALLELLDAC